MFSFIYNYFCDERPEWQRIAQPKLEQVVQNLNLLNTYLRETYPDDERFQNFSPDTRRGLRKILNLHKSPSDSEYRDYQYVKKVIPEFVKNETKPMSSYDAINAGLEENIKPTAA